MKHLDLFSGIGGFALAAKWVWGEQHEIVSFVEIDKFCQKVLNKHWPDVPIHGDIQTYDGTKYKGKIDLITGGFPCQDISHAGKGEGIKGKRSGLWSEMWRLISEIRPKFVIIENVSAILIRGLETILRDLAEIGYNAEWQCISASEVGAWHRRERFWLVAYSKRSRLNRSMGYSGIFKKRKKTTKEWSLNRIKLIMGNNEVAPSKWLYEGHETNPRSLLLRDDNGFSYGVDRLKSLGNAIVPQVVAPIMCRIKEFI